MNCSVYCKRAAPLALVIFLLPRVNWCQSSREQMKKEIGRIASAIQAKPDSDKDWKDAKPDIVNSLKAARESLAAGRLFLALENLGEAKVNLAVAESMLGKPEVLKQGMPGFEAEWRKADGDLKVWERRYEEGRMNSVPLAVRAIAEANSAESRRYYTSSRAYANASAQPGAEDAKAGLNILGAAKGAIEFAVFCESLRFKDNPSVPPLRSLAPELHQLEENMIAAYQPPRSIDKHPEFIRMHSALKEARDLEAEHLYAGALYKYLDALQMFDALDAPRSGNASTPEELQKKVQQMRESFGSGIDSSMIQIFLERAESSDLAAANAKGPSKSQIQQAILAKVVPAYYATLEKQDAPTQTRANTITVTLVRWPYT
jgi:hypothetical protein